MEHKGKAPIELYLLKYWSTLGEAAEAIGVTYQALKVWRDEKPYNLLKHTPEILNLTGGSVNELWDSVKANIEYLEK